MRDIEFDERVRVAAEAGFAAIGLAAGEYLRLREAGWTDDRLVTTAAHSGLVVDEIEALRLDGTRRNEDVMWRMADMFGASHVHVLGPYVGDMSAAADELARICDEAATHGLRAAIEFFPPTNVPDVRTAMDIVRAADRNDQRFLTSGRTGPGLLPSPELIFETFRDDFDVAYREGTLFVLTLHPYLSGHRAPMKHLTEFVAYMKSKPGVWFATAADIARYVKEPR